MKTSTSLSPVMGLYTPIYTVILPKEVEIELDAKFKLFFGKIEQVDLEIKKQELAQDALFSGHIIINDISCLTSTLEYYLAEKNLSKLFSSIIDEYPLNYNNVYLNKVYHHGMDSRCYVQDKIVYCSSWTLPFYSYIKRADNTLYANFARHRIQMNRFLKPLQNESSNID